MPTKQKKHAATTISLLLLLAGPSACTRLLPPAYNVSTAQTPQLLLEIGAPTWIGVRHAGGKRVGVMLLGTSFSQPKSVTCVYRKAKDFGFVFKTPEPVVDEETAKAKDSGMNSPGPGQRCGARYDRRRLVAVLVNPGAGQEAPTPTADGMICSHRCNRVRSRRHYMDVEVLGAEPKRAPDPAPATETANDAPAAGANSGSGSPATKTTTATATEGAAGQGGGK